MMRSSRPLLARSNMAATTATPIADNSQAHIPSIRLVSDTPSASGLSFDASTSFNYTLDQSWSELGSQQSILAPKSDVNDQPRKKLVPKKSKLGILTIGRDKQKDQSKDLSDVVRRIGAPASASGRGGFEIYVDPMVDPDVGEILIVKKKKSRIALDGMAWGALGESTNVPKSTQIEVSQPVTNENPALLKVKAEEDRKWWSIGRGRKDSKDKGKENKTMSTNQESPGRFNSLDSGLLLGKPTAQKDASVRSNVRAQTPTVQMSEPEPERARSATPSTGTFFRSSAPTVGGFLAPPGPKLSEDKPGSIAIRAIRSMRSLARMGSWAQLTNSSPPTAQELAEEIRKAESEGEKRKDKKVKKKKDGTVKEKKKKDGTIKEKKKNKEDGSGTIKKSLKGEKAQTLRISTSSFEVGHLSASPEPPKAAVSKKHSILGLGLPSTMRLPRMRGGSTASSLNPQPNAGVPSSSPVNSVPPSATLSVFQPNRLSVENISAARPSSALSSNPSSLRPVSLASSTSRLSTGSSVVSAGSGTSVKWDEQGLETVREQRRRERAERRMSEDSAASADKTDRRSSRESRRSSEGRRRTPLSSIFPEIHQIGVAMLNDVAEESQENIKDVLTATASDSDVASMTSTNTTSSMRTRRRSYGAYPILTIEEATSDGHGDLEEEAEQDGINQVSPTATPVKRRVRPMSEQLIGRARPKAIHEDEEGVISILSAVTDDLASILNTFEATPTSDNPFDAKNQAFGTNQVIAHNQEAESPLNKTLRRQVSSVASLRPYAQSRGYGATKSTVNIASDLENKKQSHPDLIGQPIAPWPVLIAAVSPAKSKKTEVTGTVKTVSPARPFKPGHKRTMTPAPDPDPEPTFQPLKPARTKAPLHDGTIRGAKPNPKLTVDVQTKAEGLDCGLFASPAFGPKSSRGSMIMEEFASSTSHSGSLTPVFKRIHELEGLDRAPDDGRNSWDSRSRGSLGDSLAIPITKEARKALGRSGTLGGSDISGYGESQLDTSDPNSDVPDELKAILAAHSDQGSAAGEENKTPVSSSAFEILVSASENLEALPQAHEPPIFRLTLTDDDGESAHSSEEDTKKSFDFTGEINKLNETADRASFVEQLEMAFKTPAKIDLHYGFPPHLRAEVPPLPTVLTVGSGDGTLSGNSSSVGFEYHGESQLLDFDALQALTAVSNSQDSLIFNDDSASNLVDVGEPTLLRKVIPDETGVTNSPSQRIELARSTRSTRSGQSDDGELDRSFKFGGRPKNPASDPELTLSDIIPPPECARAISEASMLEDFEDDSVLRSIYAKLMDRENVGGMYPQSDSMSYEYDGVTKEASRPPSGVSFAFDSFDEVRRGFEFSGDRSFYPPPTRANRRATHRRDESGFSIASISSYGRVLNNGVNDPFDYGLPSLRERPSSEDISGISMTSTVEDTFAFVRRQRVDSDASTFFFRPLGTRGHGRRESNISVTSQGPPISLYNRSFGHHRRNDSSASSSSVAMSYAKHGANSGIAAWARHRQEASMDSVVSDFSLMHLGRPGIGDKMFDHAVDLGPLTSISASPMDRLEVSESGYYDSIMDDDEQRMSMDDSLFEKTGQDTSISSDSVFGDAASHPYMGGLLPQHQFRPLSVLSLNNSHGPIHEDDTMISMLGGGHVRRRSLVSLMDASPCIRIEKRKHCAIQEPKAFKNVERHESPNKARIVEKPSIASQFGEERMIKAREGLLERQSLEDSCFVADGEDMSDFCMPVFTRSLPARSRSSTCTSSSGAGTPPLASSDSSSISEGSQSSIDLSQVTIALANATHPLSDIGKSRTRVRARGKGHRRRYSRSHVSRSSVYETIEEEVGLSPSKSVASKKDDLTTRQAIFIVDSDTTSIHSKGEESVWDDERGIVALRKFYALRDEAENTVSESKRIWTDTPFSLSVLQSFQPPDHPVAMQALLEHSVQSYGPLPSELRPHRVRSRTSSRPSPYPPSRISKSSVATKDHNQTDKALKSTATPVLRELPVYSNVSAAPALDALKPFSPLVIKTEKMVKDDKNKIPLNARLRVGSTARRTALGWSKRSTGGKAEQKENAVGKENLVGNGTNLTPANTLRLSRPRPKGRTPASQNRPIRV